ncbi:hypothetical protein DFR29_104121 [Tahibacter aquaticus]|uniref:Uncharacterized protein n=1 Tax=Tahibacter aquaticus TaxID=520092 RepID=A0A4R6Z292_9GAMM|nr:hypothetical protein [Tahibacter aquaticus]TDR45693.1 hypothetical protein DFR29_104121 [Tahibacter aquaticus]
MSNVPVRSFPSQPSPSNPTAAVEPAAPITAEPSKQEKDRPLWWLPGTVFLFPFGYVAGRAYRESFIGHLGLLESDLTLAPDEYVYRGFMALISLADHLLARVSPELATGWYLSYLGLGMIVTFVIFATSRFTRAIGQRMSRLKARAESFRAARSPDFKASLAVVISTWIAAVAPMLFLFALGLLVFPAFLAGEAGKWDAQALLQSVRASGAEERYPSVGSVSPVPGAPRELVVECRPSACVVFTGKRFTAVRREAIPRIEGVAR